MRVTTLSLMLALVAVALLAAQVPNSGSEEQAKAGKASAADDAKGADAKGADSKGAKAEPARGFPRSGEAPPGARGGFRGSPPGFQPGSRGGFIPSQPPITTRTTEPAERPGLRLPQPMAPLPEGAASAKSLLLDVCFAQTADMLAQPSAADLLAMERDGKLKSNSRVRLLLLENQPAFAQFGELANRVAGHTNTGLRVMPIYNSVNVGMIVQATGRVADDGTILLQVYIEKSELEASDAPAETRPPEDIARLITQSTVRLKPGEPVVVSSGPAGNSDARSQNWIVLSCQAL